VPSKIILLTILFGLTARADSFAFLGSSLRFATTSSGAGLNRYYPVRLGGGTFISSKYAIGGDLTRYDYETEAGNVKIGTEHYELMAWLRGSMWEQPDWRPYGLVGLGVQRVSVTTTFQGESSKDQGKLEWAPGVGAGSFNRISGNFSGGAELRYIYRPWASPRWTIDLFASLGWIF